jgi:hypothetical protein
LVNLSKPIVRRILFLLPLALGLIASLPSQDPPAATLADSSVASKQLTRPKALGPPADNSRCFVCHLNYEDEEFAVKHAKGGVGCEKCHGKSDAHASDENNGTAPDTMYPRSKVTAACADCHKLEQVVKVEKHQPDLDALAADEKVCTDCHKTHRLERRSRRWDRETGRPLPLPKEKPRSGAS